MSSKKIFVSGSLAYDRIMDFPGKFEDHILPEKIHILNVCFMVNGLQEKFGGTAGNIAYNLALLDEKPVILATAGKDFESYRKWLMAHGLPLEGIRPIDQEFTAGAYITTDMGRNQITGFNPGAMNFPSLYGFNGAKPKDSLAIVAPGNLDDMLVYSRKYKEMGLPYIFDPGQSIPALTSEQIMEMIDGSRLLITNDYELEMIMQPAGMNVKDILARTPAVITTLGEKGAMVCCPGGDEYIPITPPQCVEDPTGAGDAFRAGLIKGMIEGRELVQAAQMGSVSASYAVEHYGTQEHSYHLDQYWDRFNMQFKQG
jgi:adenosine kinase